jgi:hypothetical protein
MLFFYSMCRASGRIAIGDSGGWVEARRAFAALYWGLEIGQQAWLTEGVEYDQTTSAAKEFMSFHGLALAGGAGELAAWHAHFLRNLLSGGSVAGEVFEPDLIAFYTHIIVAHVTGIWPEVRDLSPELGAFRPLLEAVDDKDAFASALVRYCDFRLSRAYQFENTEARKPRRATDTMYVFEAQWLALFPFELCSCAACIAQYAVRNSHSARTIRSCTLQS